MMSPTSRTTMSCAFLSPAAAAATRARCVASVGFSSGSRASSRFTEVCPDDDGEVDDVDRDVSERDGTNAERGGNLAGRGQVGAAVVDDTRVAHAEAGDVAGEGDLAPGGHDLPSHGLSQGDRAG